MKDGTKIVLALLALAGVGGALAWAARGQKPKLSDGEVTPGEQPADDPLPEEPEEPEDPGHGPGPKPLPKPDMGLGAPPGKSKFLGVLSRQANGGVWCDAPIIPLATNSYQGKVRAVHPNAGPVWGWQRPGGTTLEENAIHTFGDRLILALVSKNVSPEAGWGGGNINMSSARYFASLASPLSPPGGVSWSGFIYNAMKPVLAEFAKKGITGYPGVLVQPSKDKPRDWLGAILKDWYDIGFTALVPIIDVTSGSAHLAELVDECERRGLSYMLSSLQAIEQLKIDCTVVAAGEDA